MTLHTVPSAPMPQPPAMAEPALSGGPIRRAFLKHPWWFGIIACALFVPIIRPLTRYEPALPPVHGALPGFTLVDQAGAPFDLERMRGKVWVASFFFVSCPSV